MCELKFQRHFVRELLKTESNDLLKLPTDRVLVEDPQFRKYVELYAQVPKELNNNISVVATIFSVRNSNALLLLH